MVIICNCKHLRIHTPYTGNGTEIHTNYWQTDCRLKNLVDVDGWRFASGPSGEPARSQHILDGVISNSKKKDLLLAFFGSQSESKESWHGPSASHPRPDHRFNPAESNQNRIESWTPLPPPVSPRGWLLHGCMAA